MSRFHASDENKCLRSAAAGAFIEVSEIYPTRAIDLDLMGSTKMGKYKEKFPDRYFNLRTRERAGVGVAAGMASEKGTPIVCTFSKFFNLSSDIIEMTAEAGFNVKYYVTHIGHVGEDGKTHTDTRYAARFRSIHNLVLCSPSDAVEAADMVKEMFAENGFARVVVDGKQQVHKGPVAICVPRDSYQDLVHKNHDFRIGVWEDLAEGEDVAILSYSTALHKLAFPLYNELIGKEINPAVVNSSSISPMDTEKLKKLCKNYRLLVFLEDHYVKGGLGEEIGSFASHQDPPAAVSAFGVNGYTRSGPLENQLAQHFDIEQIAESVKSRLERLSRK